MANSTAVQEYETKRTPGGGPLPEQQPDKVERTSISDADAQYELRCRYDPDSADSEHYAYQRNWWYLVNMFTGNQHNASEEFLYRTAINDDPDWRVYYTANIIMPTVMRAVGAMFADGPPIGVAPSSAEVEDRSSARLAVKLWRYLQKHLKYEDKRSEAGLWAAVCGTGFLKFTWNRNIGPKIRDQEGKERRLGDIVVEVANPFQVRVPDRLTKLEKFPWIYQETTMAIETAMEMWPEKKHLITPQRTTERQNFFEDRLTSLVGIKGTQGVQDTEGDPRTVRVGEMWIRPFTSKKDGKRYPKGLQIIEISGAIIEAKENPYVDLGMDLPFRDFHWQRIPGRFWGMGLVEQLCPIQEEYNRSRGQMIEYMDLMMNGKWLLPKNHGIPATAITRESGEIIEYNPALPAPQMITPPPPPGTFFNHFDLCRAEMQEVSSQHDASEAKAPGSVRSGLAISLLQQQDLTTRSEAKKDIWRTDLECGKTILTIAQKMYTTPRQIKIIGRGKEWQVVNFVGSDIEHATDLVFLEDPADVLSKQAQRQLILDYVELGILNPQDPDHHGLIIEALELGSLEGYNAEKTLDEENADNENQLMSSGTGEIPEVSEWDDHRVHRRVHRRLILSNQFRQMHPVLKEGVVAHMRGHEMYEQQALMAQMQMLEAQKGAPGDKGDPSAPKSGGGGDGGGSEGKQGGGSSGSKSSGEGGGQGSQGGGGSGESQG